MVFPQIKSLEQENSHGSKSGFIYLSTSTANGRKTKTRTSLVRLHFLVKSCPCHCFLLRFYPAEPLVTQHPTSKSSISGSCRCNTRRISSSSSSSSSSTSVVLDIRDGRGSAANARGQREGDQEHHPAGKCDGQAGNYVRRADVI